MAAVALHPFPSALTSRWRAAKSALVQPASCSTAQPPRVCVLQTKIGLSKGRHNSGQLKGSHFCLLLSVSLYHTFSNEKKNNPAHTSEHAVALTKWLISLLLAAHFPLPPWIHQAPNLPSKWLAPPGVCLVCHPSSAVTLRQRWRSDGAPITAAIQFLSPPQKKIHRSKMALTYTDSWRRVCVGGCGVRGGGGSAYPHQSK